MADKDTHNERIAKRATEIAEELRRAMPPNTDFEDGWQQRYIDRQNERFEKALETAREEARNAGSPSLPEQPGQLDYAEWKRRYAARLMHHGWNERAAIKEAEYAWQGMEGVEPIPTPEDAADQATADARAEDAVAPAQPGWQPIETAPKGRTMLVAYRNKIGKWRRVMACYYTADAIAENWETDDAPEGWYETSETHCEDLLPTEGEPELWHELPVLAAAPASPSQPTVDSGEKGQPK